MDYNGYKIVSDGTFGYKEVKPLGRGSVPLTLRGTYTTEKVARQAIDAYLSVKAATNDKTD